MFVIPWWALLVLIVVLLYLIARMIDLSRRSKKLRDIVYKLEGAQGEEKREKFEDTETGGFE
ncbi:MAG: hypothetical protein V1696_01585 [Candidatus Jorgensenbacteria bacterium]